MSEVSIVIPNYNGLKFIDECMEALLCQSYTDFDVIVVDNGSEDGSLEAFTKYSNRIQMKIIKNAVNLGFAAAVNQGIKASEADYVILLNNDTHAGKNFVKELVLAMEADKKVFSAQALMIQYHNRKLADSAGDYFCALGWSFSRGKDKPVSLFRNSEKIFSSCAGAAIYRRSIFEKIGYFDETFFAYLEDVDIGYRAGLYGYKNIYVPGAKVLHVGSGFSGSRHNDFKVRLAARNSMLLMYKNFAPWQWIVNLIPIIAGICIKSAYFANKGLLHSYISGILNSISKTNEVKKLYNSNSNLNYFSMEIKLLYNILLRF